MAFIRPYQPSDEEAIIHIFRETASQDLKEAGDQTLHYASYNWARPYIHLVPQHCLVIDDGQGVAVGYLLGVPDTTDFVANFETVYLPHIEAQGVTKPPMKSDKNDTRHPGSRDDVSLAMRRITWAPEEMLHVNHPNLVRRYPAHLHIDILPSHQNLGWGRKMIEQTLARFREMGVPGIHLGKVGSNVSAGRFYARLGFDRFEESMDGGESGEVGRVRDGGIYLVKILQ